MYLHKIQQAVNKAAQTYLQHNALQRVVCKRLIQLLTQYQDVFDTVADIACGVGDSTRQLMRTVQANHYIATDISAAALSIASKRLPPSVELVHADFHMPLLANLDLIFCNMGLHWSIDLLHVLKTITASLNPYGLLAFSLPVAGTFHELKADSRLDFTRVDAIISLLYKLGLTALTTDTHTTTIDFPSSISAIKSLKYTGTQIHFHESKKHLHTRQHIDNYFIEKDKFQLTYNVAMFIAHRPIT